MKVFILFFEWEKCSVILGREGEKAGVRVDIVGWEEVPRGLRGKQQDATHPCVSQGLVNSLAPV